jgi:methionyl-tRNA formyltransferase
LPEHRGPNPYTSTIKEGETKTGITFHLVDEGIDSGAILLQKEINISDDDTGESLRVKASYKARESVKELLDGLENARFLPQKQDAAKATYFPRVNEDDAVINWNKSAQSIHDQIRGLYPWLICYTRFKNDFFKIKSSKIVDLTIPSSEAGRILAKSKNSLLVSTADPLKAVLIRNLELYGLFGAFGTGFYLSKKIKIGDILS